MLAGSMLLILCGLHPSFSIAKIAATWILPCVLFSLVAVSLPVPCCSYHAIFILLRHVPTMGRSPFYPPRNLPSLLAVFLRVQLLAVFLPMQSSSYPPRDLPLIRSRYFRFCSLCLESSCPLRAALSTRCLFTLCHHVTYHLPSYF
ncbi:hypothetical protein DFJ77DRAFT_463170 [Powellomyces hirtus]|nr:hypothetical protein DFJ77DRAFT_463170 [Powellomyces hirtus]